MSITPVPTTPVSLPLPAPTTPAGVTQSSSMSALFDVDSTAALHVSPPNVGTASSSSSSQSFHALSPFANSSGSLAMFSPLSPLTLSSRTESTTSITAVTTTAAHTTQQTAAVATDLSVISQPITASSSSSSSSSVLPLTQPLPSLNRNKKRKTNTIAVIGEHSKKLAAEFERHVDFVNQQNKITGDSYDRLEALVVTFCKQVDDLQRINQLGTTSACKAILILANAYADLSKRFESMQKELTALKNERGTISSAAPTSSSSSSSTNNDPQPNSTAVPTSYSSEQNHLPSPLPLPTQSTSSSSSSYHGSSNRNF